MAKEAVLISSPTKAEKMNSAQAELPAQMCAGWGQSSRVARGRRGVPLCTFSTYFRPS